MQDIATPFYAHRLMSAEWQLFADLMGGTRTMRQAGLRWMILAEPVLRHILVISGQHIDLPVLRYDILFELTLGMLGMAGLRSFDKLKGTS